MSRDLPPCGAARGHLRTWLLSGGWGGWEKLYDITSGRMGRCHMLSWVPARRVTEQGTGWERQGAWGA